jgi:crossover junction endodeoxyribonuclease RuvC
VLVLGIDPGTAATGYGVVSRAGDGALSLVECGVVRPRPRGTLAERLRDLFTGVDEVIARHRPDTLAVEGVFFGKNVRSAVVLGHARGVVLLAAALRETGVAEYPPAEIKSAVVGAGAATKDQVAYMVQKLLRLREPPRPHDAADGVAVALCHCFRGGGVPGSAGRRTTGVDPLLEKLRLAAARSGS